MKHESIRCGIAMSLAIGFVCGVGLAQTPEPVDAQQALRNTELKNAGPKASVAILPVRVLGKPSRNVADALGLVLEKSGMENLEAVDATFDLPEGTPWGEAPAHFGDFLKKNPPKTAYALYAEFLGDPKTGPTEVRWLIVDASGALVVSDRQLPADPDFRRTAARDRDPMGCSMLVAERVFSTLAWKKGTGGKTPAKFAQLWAEKSGTASDEERAAMKTRAGKLKDAIKTSRIGVYATRVDNAPDAQSGARLAKELGKLLSCSVIAAQSVPQFEIRPTSNEQKRLWDLARGFREHLRANRTETDYAILAEYLIEPARGAHSVHFVVCDKAGDWVIVDFQNNQHADFQRVVPKSVEDCERLTCERLEGYLR